MLQQDDIFQEVVFEDFHQLMNWFSVTGDFHPYRKHYIFRGEGSDRFTLLPTALRPKLQKKVSFLGKTPSGDDGQEGNEYWQIISEYNILKDYYSLCDTNGIYLPDIKELRESIHTEIDHKFTLSLMKWLPDYLWEIAGLAQHYGLPTRLLDWTYDYNVALYFAAMTSVRDNDDSDYMVLWLLNIVHFEMYKQTEAQQPVVFIRPAYARNENLTAQKGLFLLWPVEKKYFDPARETDREPLDEKIIRSYQTINNHSEFYKRSKVMYRLKISKKLAGLVISHLDGIGYRTATIYPGMDGIVKQMEQRF